MKYIWVCLTFIRHIQYDIAYIIMYILGSKCLIKLFLKATQLLKYDYFLFKKKLCFLAIKL